MSRGSAQGTKHLARRFFGSLRPGGPRRSDVAWVGEVLLPAELAHWQAMAAADRRHAVGVARRVEQALAARRGGASGLDAATRRAVLAAALLHDVGKGEARLSTFERVGATLAAGALGRERVVAWTEGRGLTRRFGLYLQHPKLGGDLLALAGSAPLTVAWTREHHLPAERWTVPRELGEVLAQADDD